MLGLAVLIGVLSMTGATATAAVYNNCINHPTLYQGDSGSCVSLAQHNLAAKGYLTATATGYYGPATKAAVIKLQRDKGLNQTGFIGPKTWAALTTAATTASKVPSKCLTTRKTICVVKGSDSQATLYAIQNKKVVKSFPARTGDARGKAYATGVGSYSVGRKYVHYYSKSFNNAPMPYSLFFNGGQAIHYSDDFAKHGYGGLGSSAGCVNLNSMTDAKWLYDWSPIYTSVIVTK